MPLKWIPHSKSRTSKSRPRWAAHTRIGNVWGEIGAIGKLKLNLTEVGQFKNPLEAVSYTRSKTQEITQ